MDEKLCIICGSADIVFAENKYENTSDFKWDEECSDDDVESTDLSPELFRKLQEVANAAAEGKTEDEIIAECLGGTFLEFMCVTCGHTWMERAS